jgi:small subunit ribosomal protein S25e
MGKQPTTGQKKSKDTIAKAASQKKGPHKKWTKGKAK